MAGNKKITQLTELVTLDSNTWLEAIDLNETDPNLQNKKVNYTNFDNPDTHVQNTDQYLDFGGFNQISAVSLIAMQTSSHDHDTDTYLDKGQANEVTAANAALAVSKMHDQGTDQYLDQGGADEVSAYTTNVVVYRQIILGWVYGDASSTSQMSIGIDSGGERVLQFNNTAMSVITVSAVLAAVAAGRSLAVSFPNGHYIGNMNTQFAAVSSWQQVVCTTESEGGTWDGVGILTII